jgi:hypothetical protein
MEFPEIWLATDLEQGLPEKQEHGSLPERKFFLIQQNSHWTPAVRTA